MIERLLEVLLLSDNSPGAQKRWRTIVAVALLGMISFAIWALGGAERFGSAGFASAAQIDSKIAAAVQPLNTELHKHGDALESISVQLRESLAEAKAGELRAVALKRCKSTDQGTRDDANREIDRKQEEYYRMQQRYYQIPECPQL